MEALLIINSILVAVCLYFIKDFHTDFKEVAKKVGRLETKVHDLAIKISSRLRSIKKSQEN